MAIDLVSRNLGEFSGLIVENTFQSLVRKRVYLMVCRLRVLTSLLQHKVIPVYSKPLGYVTFLCHDKWNSEKRIQAICDLPVLFLSGSKDEIIPQSQMKALFKILARNVVPVVGDDSSKDSDPGEFSMLKKLAAEKNITFKEFENGTHNDTCAMPGYFVAISDFLERI